MPPLGKARASIDEMFEQQLGRKSRRATSVIRRLRKGQRAQLVARSWELVTLPITAYFLLANPRIDEAYGFTWRQKFALAWRMWRTTRYVTTATTNKAHLAMAAKLFQIPPQFNGVVVECGTFHGGSTANLSLACKMVGRKLFVYDSFEGLPAPRGNDSVATESQTGGLRGTLGQVKANVDTYGAIECCVFRRGWFEDTLPRHRHRIVLAFLDVDYQASLEECVRNLWPHLVQQGYLFTDEYVLPDMCALFWSERYWHETFNTTPPGLIGSGSGVGVGQYYLGPWLETLGGPPIPQAPTSIAYTRKDFSGYWDYDLEAGPG